MRAIVLTISGAAILAALAISCGGNSTGSGSETRTPGEIAFRSSCQTCHSLPKARMKTDDEWPALVQRYGERAKLNGDQIAAITAYLVASN